MDPLGSGSTLPLYAQLQATAVLLLVLAAALRLAPGTSARFVVFACWLRFMISAFHDYTYQPVFMGLSGSAVGSAFLFSLGALLVPRRLLMSSGIVTAYAVVGAILLSAFANGAYRDAIDPVVKFGLFIVIALHCYNALSREDERRFGMAALLGFTPLLLFQALSVMLGISKTGNEGSSNYIGGYNHEAAFSVALAALLVVAALSNKLPRSWKTLGLLLPLAGILVANYRTAILAMLPLILFYFMKAIVRLFGRNVGPLLAGIAGIALLAVGTTSLLTMDRFADLRVIAQSEEPLIKPPESFSTAETALLSSRSYVWSDYLYTWKDRGTQLQHLVGFGPESWPRYFPIYAHNTFIDFLFEYGIFGLAMLIVMIGAGLVLAAKGGRHRMKLLAAHASFLILNLATMPMWLVEGLILYGLLWGYTMFYRWQPAVVVQPVRQPPVLRAVPT